MTATIKYDAYGYISSRTGSGGQIFGYNGRDGVLTDPNGLLYMRNRYYSPVLRRFLNCDIIKGNIADSTTLNLYTYVNGNPISFVDPFGLSKERGQPITIYHGIINNSEDTKYADKTIKELREIKNISALDFLFQDETYRLFTMGLLANELSSGKMRNVVNEMILYFAVGVGGEYSNDILTDIVKNNDVTQKYMEDITLCFLSYYKFGLDSDDINTFGLMEGFRSWYILQHYDMYE